MKRPVMTVLILALALAPLGAASPPGEKAGRSTPAPDAGTNLTPADEGGVGPVLDRTPEIGTNLDDREFGYAPEGRRDPFEPYAPKIDSAPPTSSPGIEEVTLVGVVRSADGKAVAVFFGGREETGYFMREGMRFRDAEVREVDLAAARVLVSQPNPDPPPPFREFDIFLHPQE